MELEDPTLIDDSAIQQDVESEAARHHRINITIEVEAYEDRIEARNARSSSSATSANYARHVQRYQTYFLDIYRTQKDDKIAPLPITPAKVTLFLKYESTRPKRLGGRGSTDLAESDQNVVGETVGMEHLKQVSSC